MPRLQRFFSAAAALSLCAWLILSSSPVQAAPQQLDAPKDHFSLLIPSTWKTTGVHQGSTSQIARFSRADGLSFSLHVFHLKGSNPKAHKQHATKLYDTSKKLEKIAGFGKGKEGELDLPATSCRITDYQDGDEKVLLVGCPHPSAPRFFLWRVHISKEQAKSTKFFLAAFGEFISNNLVFLGADLKGIKPPKEFRPIVIQPTSLPSGNPPE